MKPIGPFRYLSRWNRRAVVVVVVLLLCAWFGFFVRGMFPLHSFNVSLYQGILVMACGLVVLVIWRTILMRPGIPRQGGPWRKTAWRLIAAGGCLLLLSQGLLAMACGFVLFLIWLTILISPGIPRQERLLRETAWRLTAAGGCLLLGIILAVAGGGPDRLGTRIGGKLSLGLQPVRDLQRSPAVIALAQGRESARLPKDQWPDSITGTGSWPFDWKEPGDILVLPSPVESPSLRMYYGRGSLTVVVQNFEPEETKDSRNYVVEQWANDVWLCRNLGD
jgi:hypothetical protein